MRHYFMERFLSSSSRLRATGYSGTVFGRHSVLRESAGSIPSGSQNYSEFIYGQRAHETNTVGQIQDLFITDALQVALFGRAFTQEREMNSFWNRMTDTGRDSPLFDAYSIQYALMEGGVTAVGHSLGGHLAFLFSKDHPDDFNQGFTYNGAGLFVPYYGPGPSSIVRAWADGGIWQTLNITPGSFVPSTEWLNLYAERGPEIIAGVHTVIGDKQPLYIEEVGFPTRWPR